ncbi:hypothetical protein [Kutzneria buriramensis]|uniref:Scaffolding protein n=1 Tax=Kutzneria buriramensis TaxID=1045776 RepID=A0A3E0HDI1_9PSEU|nr:hypothetical protein [Kutzneria buriramensis]REH42712.1 hypothetical protein BCF44_110209 [Kutzneria buriramensis]
MGDTTGQAPADNQPPGPVSTTDPAPQQQPQPEPAEPDYKALYEAAQAKLSKAEQTARSNKDKAKRLDEIEAAQQSEAEKAAARATAAEQQLAGLRRRAIDAEIRAAATGWADPTDAPRYLDERDRYIGDDGVIDTAAIAHDLAAVLAARPHLARVDGPRRPAPDPSQGPRDSGPSGIAGQISEAEARGDWVTAIALKNKRLRDLAAQQH